MMSYKRAPGEIRTHNLATTAIPGTGVASGTAAAPAPTAAATTSNLVTDDPATETTVSHLLTALPGAASAGRTSVLAPAAHTSPSQLRALFPPGTTVAPVPGTWRRTGSVGSMTTVVVRPGSQPVSYDVVLFLEPGGWKVAMTFPAAKATA
jgi:hypothetical protein